MMSSKKAFEVLFLLIMGLSLTACLGDSRGRGGDDDDSGGSLSDDDDVGGGDLIGGTWTESVDEDGDSVVDCTLDLAFWEIGPPLHDPCEDCVAQWQIELELIETDCEWFQAQAFTTIDAAVRPSAATGSQAIFIVQGNGEEGWQTIAYGEDAEGSFEGWGQADVGDLWVRWDITASWTVE